MFFNPIIYLINKRQAEKQNLSLSTKDLLTANIVGSVVGAQSIATSLVVSDRLVKRKIERLKSVKPNNLDQLDKQKGVKKVTSRGGAANTSSSG